MTQTLDAQPIEEWRLIVPVEPSADTPYIGEVPKDLEENRKYRSDLIAAANGDASLVRELIYKCKSDLLFYVNSFVWTFDPRKKDPVVPFVTWEFQDEALIEMNDAINDHDLVIEKSRDMGASWLAVVAFEWRWHFFNYQSFLLVSRKEEYVDKRGDPKSLFWKLDFILDDRRMPGWLRPGIDRKHMHLFNEETSSTINGESTTGDVARGDRRTAILLDEFASVDNGHAALASTGDATNCRIFNSTPKGSGNAFYDVAHGKMKKIRFHWSSHPEKIQDSYVDAAGKTRSPWYDAECERRTSPVEIAQEIDIDYLGSDHQFFDSDALDGIMKKTVCDPYVICNMEGDGGLNPKSLIPSPEGVLRLWVYPDGEDQLPGDREYVAGVDIATGTGGSNSVVSVADRHTAEKVAELATPSVRPDVFAEMTLMLLRWFHDAYVIWEANGPGRIFGDRLIELGYRNIYYRKSDGKLPASSTQFPGWWASGTSKMSLLGDYRRALFSGDFLNRSKIALTECRQIVFAPGGRVVHSRSEITHDPSGAKENHGDRVTADALCWKAVGEVKRPVAEPEQEIIPGSLAWRRSERKKTEKKRRW